MKKLLLIALSLTAVTAFAANDHVFKGTERVSDTTERDITIEINDTLKPVAAAVKDTVLRAEEGTFDEAKRGMAIQVTNSLPQADLNDRRVTPSIQAYLCSPALFPSQPTENRCVTLDGEIKAGETALFLLLVEQLDKVFKNGGGKASFEFSDKFQKTSKSWGCESPNSVVTLDSNFDAKQTWQLNVIARNKVSYTCSIVQK